jgi:ArsR family transcriptional regulator, cadmium/lead-responsive transcriptional repressor
MLTLVSEVEVLARFGRALADPIRCRLLLALCDAPAHPSDLAERLGVSRTRLSNHLACLRDCGLVDSRPVGRASMFSLTTRDELSELLGAAEGLLALTGDAVDLCPVYGSAAREGDGTR